MTERFWSKVAIGAKDECWSWTASRQKSGYGKFGVSGKTKCAHRIAWELTFGSPGELSVLHRCDNPPCCNPSHMYLGTDKDNAVDKVRKNRQRKGEGVPQHALTEPDVIEIRKRAASGETHDSLAAEYGVGQSTISRAVSGACWKHIA